MNNVCENIYKTARKRADLKRAPAAEELGVAVRTLDKYENFELRVPDEIVKRMCYIYNNPHLAWQHLKKSDLGEFLPDIEETNIQSATLDMHDCGVPIISDEKGNKTFKCQYETIGQFTGLTDKNGKKIFEGDIVRYGTNINRADNKDIHEVVFETRGSCGYFGIKISDIETWQFCLEVPAKLMEVIGNIHDNPELLREGTNK